MLFPIKTVLKCLPSFPDQPIKAYLCRNIHEMLYICSKRYPGKHLTEILQAHSRQLPRTMKCDTDSSVGLISLKTISSTVINLATIRDTS